MFSFRAGVFSFLFFFKKDKEYINIAEANRMSIENLKSFDPFADTGDDETATSNYIHIRIQQRNGRKTLTTVQGVPEEYDLKRILKVLKKDFACNGNIVKDPEMGEIIQLQGDQRAKVCEFMITQLGLQKKNIKIHGF